MIVIETCPQCGNDLHTLMLAAYPPIQQKQCFACGWEWTGESEQIVRIPFGGNTLKEQNEYTLFNGYFNSSTIRQFSQPACATCHSNPKNGGDGICFCTLGQMNVVY